MPDPQSQVPASPPAIPGVTVVTTGTLSPGDLAALRLRASELSNQLKSATGRRANVQQSLRNATGADRAGLEQRLGVLDTRIARLEATSTRTEANSHLWPRIVLPLCRSRSPASTTFRGVEG